MKTKQKLLLLGVGIVLAVTTHLAVKASDHDDGELDLKGRSLNLTDLFVFREDWHSGAAGDAGNLIFIMNSNPRSLPQQQYYFSTAARYEFHIKRQTDKTVAYKDGEDATLRFEFGAPDTTGAQAITMTGIVDGVVSATQSTSGGAKILTTPIGKADVNNTVALGSVATTVFAGLKEDPFFFDVESYFKVRSSIASSNGTSLGAGFKDDDHANDFAAGYNVNAIVVRVPISYLANGTGLTTFDVWETISIRQ